MNVVFSNPPCAHCLELLDTHVEGKCLFGATQYKLHGSLERGTPPHPMKDGTLGAGAFGLMEGDRIKFIGVHPSGHGKCGRWDIVIHRNEMTPETALTTWDADAMMSMWAE